MACRIHTVWDPMGWLCLSSIVFVWSYNTWLLPKLIMMPHVAQGTLPAAVAAGYYVVAALCMAALVRASTADPGRVRQERDMSSEEFSVQSHVCQKCSIVKPARAHHCSRCGHCVRRMDHHCPWINNCVGEGNQWLFIQLCFYTQLLSTYALVVNFAHFYLLPPLAGAQPDEFVFHYSVAMLRGAAVMGVMIFLGMAALFYGQVINILTESDYVALLETRLHSDEANKATTSVETLKIPHEHQSDKLLFAPFIVHTSHRNLKLCAFKVRRCREIVTNVRLCGMPSPSSSSRILRRTGIDKRVPYLNPNPDTHNWLAPQ